MGKKRALPNWLPAGWKVEVRARKKGKKEKWYIDPSKGLKFCSKADVLRYLSSVDSNCSKSSNTKGMEKKGTAKCSTEETASEGLPPGWIKELKVRRKGRKIRKDPYYIDPVSGQTFRSMKQVSLFLETREPGRFKSKPNDRCAGTLELEEPSSSFPAEAKQISVDSDASGKEANSNQKPKLGAEHLAHSSCVEDDLGDAVAENAAEENVGKVVLDPASGEYQEKEDDGKVISDRASGEHQEKEDGKLFLDTTSGEQYKKEDDGKVVSEPCRASKRLAGIKADTSLKLQINNQIHLTSVRQEEGTQAATSDNALNFINTSKDIATTVTGITISETVETGSLSIKRQQDVTLPQMEQEKPSPVEPAKTALGICEGNKKGEAALESSLSDLWTDPCIEFAIKTLTGTMPVINEKKVDEIPGSSSSKPSVNTPSSVGLPSDEIWADPCFMFAVKTLTGEIPIRDDLCSQNIVQQQRTSSQLQGNNGLILPNIRFEEFGQANVSRYAAQEMSSYKQQSAVAPNTYQNSWFAKFGSHQPSPLC